MSVLFHIFISPHSTVNQQKPKNQTSAQSLQNLCLPFQVTATATNELHNSHISLSRKNNHLICFFNYYATMVVASSSRTRSHMYKHRKSLPFLSSSSSGFSSSTSSSFSFGASTFFERSASPTRISMYAHSLSPPSSSWSLRFANRLVSLGLSISMKNQLPISKNNNRNSGASKRTCLCSPTTHPGSFQCALHKNSPRGGVAHQSHCGNQSSSYQSSTSLNYRRSTMKNSVVRIGRVDPLVSFPSSLFAVDVIGSR
ncbi:uncharacterized protein LOC126629902 [Malus sylvestris]|uniref:uncharacterized protein LOC126629902 n=1 Tax=Malus sylvestris TaxID=3752 RepID=UPI0021AC89D1|nr:uncharacterized protein LOC126629902 [Malus sylvestris]